MRGKRSELLPLTDEEGGIGGSGVIGGVEGSLPYVERPCEMLVISWERSVMLIMPLDHTLDPRVIIVET